MRVDRLVVASKNPEKVAEIRSVLGKSGLAVEIAEGLSWPEIDETGSTLEENALQKSRAVYAATGVPSLADDTGLFVTALGGLPGVNTARFAGPDATYADNVALLLEKLRRVEDRSASFRTVVALTAGDDELIADGMLDGQIASERRGSSGFGYDPVFEVASGRTLAQLETEEKNRLSHRARALNALFAELTRVALVPIRRSGHISG